MTLTFQQMWLQQSYWYTVTKWLIYSLKVDIEGDTWSHMIAEKLLWWNQQTNVVRGGCNKLNFSGPFLIIFTVLKYNRSQLRDTLIAKKSDKMIFRDFKCQQLVALIIGSFLVSPGIICMNHSLNNYSH